MLINLMADLRTTAPTTDFFCNLLGYHEINDGGGGSFYWDSNATESDDGGTIIQVSGIATGRWKRLYDKVVNVKWFGANGTPANDHTAFNAALSVGEEIRVPAISTGYTIERLLIPEGKRIVGEGKDVHISCTGSIAPNVNLASHTYMENINVESLQENLDWNRTALDAVEDVTLLDCSFSGFRAATGNGWGILIQNSKQVLIRNCAFENNSQSDIALVEGCEDITIINARGPALHLNLEPNAGTVPLKNITVIGGSYDVIELNEKGHTSVRIQNFSAIALSVNHLRYAGATARFDSCKIGALLPQFDDIYAGSVDFGGSLYFGPNMVKDPCLYKLNTTESAGAEWSAEYIIGGQDVTRLNDGNQNSFIRLNPGNNLTVASLKHTPIAIDSSKKYALVLTSRASYPADAIYISHHTLLVWTIDAGGTISEVGEYVHANRGAAGTETKLNTQTAILHPPANAVSLRIIVSNTSLSGSSTSAMDLYKIGLYEVSMPSEIDNGHHTTNALLNREDERYYTSGIPSAFAGGTSSLYLPGMKLYNNDISSGTVEGWICVGTGNPGTWRTFGALGI